MIKADNYSQELAHTQKNLRAASMERDSLREKSQKLEAEVEELATKYFDMEAACASHMAEVDRLRAINADMRNFLSRAIHNEGFNEEQALKFIYQ